MRWGEGVGAGEIPDQVLSTVPGVKGGSIGPLAVPTQETGGFQLRVDVDRADGPHKNVVREGMTPMPPSTAPACKTVVTVRLDIRAADAAMLADKRCADAQTNRDAELVIAQSQSQTVTRQRVEP